MFHECQATRTFPSNPNENPGEYIIQDYVFSHLYEGRKYHIRALCLLNGCERCGCSTGFFHHASPLLLLARKKFPFAVDGKEMKKDGEDKEICRMMMSNCDDDVNGGQWGDRNIHFTNWTVNKEEGDELMYVRRADEVWGQESCVMHGIRACMRETLEEVGKRPLLFAPLPQCFELFAFDFMVTDDLNVVLLEVNSGPDMDMFPEPLLKQLADDMASVVVPQSVWPSSYNGPCEEDLDAPTTNGTKALSVLTQQCVVSRRE